LLSNPNELREIQIQAFSFGNAKGRLQRSPAAFLSEAIRIVQQNAANDEIFILQVRQKNQKETGECEFH
jgi:hypothetical protein